MNYDEIEQLRTRHAAWRLLSSNNVALVLSFLGRVFVDANDSNIPAQRLIDELDDELFALNQRLSDDDGEPRFPRAAKQYLEDWASTERGWLRRFYPPGSDEPNRSPRPTSRRSCGRSTWGVVRRKPMPRSRESRPSISVPWGYGSVYIEVWLACFASEKAKMWPGSPETSMVS